jgi:excisionase family DNA binding protein
MSFNAIAPKNEGHRGLLSVDAAANVVGVSKYTLRSWIRQRRVASIRLGRRVLLDPADLEVLIRAGRVEARIS